MKSVAIPMLGLSHWCLLDAEWWFVSKVLYKVGLD